MNLRDELACQSCGRVPTSRETYHRGFEYHHRQHRADGGPDAADNLVLVCHACHRAHHDRKTDLAAVPQRPRVERFACAACGAELNPRNVEMNCGWYRCEKCRERTHLFDHFALESAAKSSE